MFRFIAPAGAPVGISQVLHSAQTALLHNAKAEEAFESLTDALGARYAFGASSGRAALSLILKSLARLKPGRTTVAVPAYTCFTVPAAIVRAGLRLHPVDVDPTTLDFSPDHLEALESRELLAIATSNLFGLANNMDRIRAVARARGAFVVDDAAQALGASWNGCNAGLLGDVGFYSFGRGKSLAAIEGAVIVTNSDEIAAGIQAEARSLPGASAAHSASLFLQLLIYAIFLRPRLYWLPNSLPFLKLGITEFNPDYPYFGLPRILQALLPQLMEQLEEANRVRRANAAALASALEGNACFTFPHPIEGCSPNYIRFPIMAKNQATRDVAVELLKTAGIGASPFYPGAVCDIDRIDRFMALRDFHCRKAEEVSRTLLTLPTHRYVTSDDLKRIISVLQKVSVEHSVNG